MHENLYTKLFVVAVALSCVILLWLFSQLDWVICNKNHAAKIVKVYSISTVFTVLIIIWLVSIGAILKESGSAIPIQGGPRTSSINTLTSSMFDVNVSSWCDRSFKQMLGENALYIIQMEINPKEGSLFIIALFSMIVLPKILSGVITFIMFGITPRTVIATTYSSTSNLDKLDSIQKIINKTKLDGIMNNSIMDEIENKVNSLKESIVDPWKYLYVAIEKVIIIAAAITTAILPISKFFMWTPFSWVFSICIPVIITSQCLVIATAVSIGTSIIDKKMRNIACLKWLV